jgi:hypothetical protein
MASKPTSSTRSAQGARVRRLSAAAAQASARAEAAKRHARVAKAQLKLARKAAKATKKAAKQARKRVEDAKHKLQAAPARLPKAVAAKAAAPRKPLARLARLHPAAAVARSVIKRLNAAAHRAVPPTSPRAAAQPPSPEALPPAGIAI